MVEKEFICATQLANNVAKEISHVRSICVYDPATRPVYRQALSSPLVFQATLPTRLPENRN